MRLRPRGRPPWWAIASGASIVLIAVFAFTRPPVVSGDTNALHRGSEALRMCLDAGVYSHCDRYAPPRGRRVDPFPPLQHLIVYPLLELGVEPGPMFRVIQVISAAALAALALLMGLIGRRTGRPWAAPLLVLIAVASPLAWYATSTFGESLALTLTAAFAAAALLRAPPFALFTLAWLAGITKETSAPFLLVLGALCLIATPLARGPLRRGHWIALGAGLLVAVASHAGLNELRFGQLTNAIYTDPAFRVPGVGLKARFALSLWASPNGGTAWFWPSITLVFAALAGIALARRGRRAWPALVLLALLAVHTALLASWWAPFGWVAWGPRLMLPLLPALALTAVVLHLDDFERLLRRIASLPLARAALVAALALAVVPQSGILIEPHAMTTLFYVPPNAHCPPDPSIINNPGGYYGCVIDTAWRRRLVLVDASSGVTRGLGPLLAITAAASVVLLTAAALRPGRRAP